MKPIAPPSLRVLPQLLEEGADFAVGLSVVHRLERRRGDEQEGDVGLLRHGLGHERLARTGRALEQHSAPRRATHGVAKGLVRQEEVDGADHLRLDGVDPDEVFEPDHRLSRPDECVRGPPGADEGRDHDRPE
jgi:hypothetical protein